MMQALGFQSMQEVEKHQASGKTYAQRIEEAYRPDEWSSNAITAWLQDPLTFVLSCFCPCCVWACNNAMVAGEPGQCFVSGLILCCLCCGCAPFFCIPCFYTSQTRTHIRTKYGIKDITGW